MGDYYLSREYLEELYNNGLRDAEALIRELAAAFVDKDGLVYGEQKISRDEIPAAIEDDFASGKMDVLKEIAPKEYERRLSEYRKALKSGEA